jgi:large subunit ribosomal protein L35
VRRQPFSRHCRASADRFPVRIFDSRFSVMPKLKTKSGAKKRFKITSSGKVLMGHAKKRHGLRKRSQTMKRTARGTKVLIPGDANIVKSFMPYA